MDIKKIIKEEVQKVLKEVWNTSVSPECYNSVKKLIEKYGISEVIYSGAQYLNEIGDKTNAKTIYDIPLN